jgi:hypothetical protein
MSLRNYFLIEYDVRRGTKVEIDIQSDERPIYSSNNLGMNEHIVHGYYENVLDKHVENLYHKQDDRVRRAILKSDIPNQTIDSLENEIQDSLDCTDPLSAVSEPGTPDLFICDKAEPGDYQFVEVKGPNEKFTKHQKTWIPKFDFLPVKVAYVYDNRDLWQQHCKIDFSKKYSNAISQPDSVADGERQEMSSREIADILSTVETGDRIRFNKRKRFLEVTDTEASMNAYSKKVTGVKLIGTQNTEYVLSKNGDWFTNGGYRRSLNWVERQSMGNS